MAGSQRDLLLAVGDLQGPDAAVDGSYAWRVAHRQMGAQITAAMHVLRLLLDVEKFTNICYHMWQLSRHLELFLVLTQSSIQKPLLLGDTSRCLSVAPHFSLHITNLLLQLGICETSQLIQRLSR